MTLSVIAEMISSTPRPVDLGQMGRDLPVRQPLGRQREDQVVDPTQPPRPLLDDLRREAAVTVPGHGDVDRADVSQQGLGPQPVAGVAAVTAGRVVPVVAEVIVDLAFERGLHHQLRQLLQQPTLTGEPQSSARARSASCRTNSSLATAGCGCAASSSTTAFSSFTGVSFFLRSYTEKNTVPTAEHPDAELAGDVIKMAAAVRGGHTVIDGVIFHTDYAEVCVKPRIRGDGLYRRESFTDSSA